MEGIVNVFGKTLNKMNITDLEASREKLETAAVHQAVPNEEAAVETTGALKDLQTMNQLWDKATHGKTGPRNMLYEKPLKDERLRRDDGR